MTGEVSGQNEMVDIAPIELPAELASLQSGGWAALPPDDPVIGHIVQNYWPGDEHLQVWEAARYSRAVYLYREKVSRWTLVVKFYTPKTGASAEKYAQRELERIEEVQASCLVAGRLRSIQAYGTWCGVLFLEHIEGLNLADIIAVRQSHPGRLIPALESVAELLAELHARGEQPGIKPDFESGLREGLKYVKQLASGGVIKEEPEIVTGLQALINRWTTRPEMTQFNPCLNHGDATTTNFMIPSEREVVAIDWERMEVADPAADLGRLVAEVLHSLSEQGGTGEELAHVAPVIFDAYRHARPASAREDALQARARFYQATSTLRIARNGWIPRLERMKLIAQAMALLSI